MTSSAPLAVNVSILLGYLLGAIIGCLIGAILLRISAKLFEGRNILFFDAFVSVLISMINIFLIDFPLRFIIRAEKADQLMIRIISVAMIPVGIAITASVISSRHELSFSKGLKISGVMFLLYVVFLGMLLGVGTAVIRSYSPY